MSYLHPIVNGVPAILVWYVQNDGYYASRIHTHDIAQAWEDADSHGPADSPEEALRWANNDWTPGQD